MFAFLDSGASFPGARRSDSRVYMEGARIVFPTFRLSLHVLRRTRCDKVVFR